jgi:hypothetical protein
MAGWANDGSAPKAVIVAGCCSNQISQTIAGATGTIALGTNQKTTNIESQTAAVDAAAVIANGGTAQDATNAANQQMKTDLNCGSNPGCDMNDKLRYEAAPPK